MKRALIALALLLTALSSFGQFTHSRLLQQVRKQGSPVVRTKAQATPVSQADSALYITYTKRNGWIEGIGRPLTPDEASHRTVYFKLSRRNAAGHWTFIQACNGLGNLTTGHGVGTYLTSMNSDSDEGVNKDWKEKIGTVCQWEFISDETGREVLQEVGMDVNGKVVYCFVPVKVGDRVYAGSYVDAKGMPVFMRTDSTGSDIGYANFVQITRDADGYERLIKYTDRYGYPQRNKDGAYMALYEHDKSGNIISSASLNIMGERMLDVWGNCGWLATYDNRGNSLTMVYTDVKGDPIRIKGVGADTINTDQVIRKQYIRDQYGRLIETRFFDADREPDTNQYGVHRVTYERSRYGYQSGYCCYGLNGQLVAGDTCGVARRTSQMDDADNLLLAEYFGENGRYVTSSYGYCKTVREYRGDEVVRQTNCIPVGDTLAVKFYYEEDSLGNEQRVWYGSNLMRLDSVDSRGNTTSTTYYNVNHQPLIYNGYHRYENNYTYGKHSQHCVSRYLDKQGRVILPEGYKWSMRIRQTDSLLHTVKEFRYRNDTLIHAEEYLYDADFNDIVRRYDINERGERSRSGYDDTFEYCWKPGVTIYGNSADFSVVNEFDEPAYLTTGNGRAYHYVNRNNGDWEYFDVHGNSMTYDETYKLYDKLPKAYCVEVVDEEKARLVGLRMGDVILAYGDWSVSRDLLTNLEGYQLETILKARHSKNMTVLRHHPEEQYSEVLTFSAPVGRPSELGFYAHLIAYTEQEHLRLLRCADNASFVYGGTPPTDEPTHTVVLMNAKKGSVDSRPGYWFYGIKDPAVLLQYTRVRDKVIPTVLASWAFDEDDPSKVKGWRLGGTWCYTSDLAHVTSMSYAGLRMDTPLVDYDVPDSIFNQLVQLYHEWQQADTAVMAHYNWRQHSGTLTMRQVAKRLGYYTNRQTVLSSDEERWERLIVDNPWLAQTSYYMGCTIYSDGYAEARNLIGALDKSGYTQEESTEADLLLVRRTGGKKRPVVRNIIYIKGGVIYMIEGELTPNYYKNLINWIEE